MVLSDDENEGTMRNCLSIILIAIFIARLLGAQPAPGSISYNPRANRPFGVSLNLGGPTYIASASLDYFILPVLNIEAGGGIWGYYAGPQYHFKGNENNREGTLYTGLMVTAFPPLPGSDAFYNAGWNVPAPKTRYKVYLPLGISSVSHNGYTFAMEIALAPVKELKIPFWFSFKFGYHFKKDTGVTTSEKARHR